MEAAESNTLTPSFMQSVMSQSLAAEENAEQRQGNDDSSDDQYQDMVRARSGEGRRGHRRPASRRSEEVNVENVSEHRLKRNRLLAEVKKSFDELQRNKVTMSTNEKWGAAFGLSIDDYNPAVQDDFKLYVTALGIAAKGDVQNTKGP